MMHHGMLGLMISYVLVACRTVVPKEPDTEKKPSTTPMLIVNDAVKQLSNKGVIFQCKAGANRVFGDDQLQEIQATVINTHEYEVYYLCQSCNGLDYYFIPDPETYQITPFFQCNATYPMICKLKAGDTLHLKTNVFKPKDAPSLQKIGLDFRVVDRFIAFDKLRDDDRQVEKIYRAGVNPKNVLWTEIR